MLQPAINTRHQWLGLGLAMAVYSGLFFYWFPPLPGIEDEVDFVIQAQMWSQGHWTAFDGGFNQLSGFLTDTPGARGTAWRNPGRPLLAIPFVWLAGVDGALASGLAYHLILTLAVAVTLWKFDVSPLWSILILCHPTFAIYSRTVMADAPAAIFTVLALRAMFSSRGSGFWTGLLLGLAATMRYPLAVLVVPAAFGLWNNHRGRYGMKQAGICLGTAGIIGFGIATYNHIAVGHILGPTHQGTFSIQYAKNNAAWYTASLLLIWPGMLLLAFLSQPQRVCIALLSLPLIGFMIPYYWMDRGSSLPVTLIVCQRLILPAVGVMIVGYCISLNAYFPRIVKSSKWRAILAGTGITILLAVTGVSFATHQKHLQVLVSLQQNIREHVPAGSTVYATSTVVKLFAIPVDGKVRYQWEFVPIDYLPQEFPNGKDWYAVVVDKSGGNARPVWAEEMARQRKVTSIDSQRQDVWIVHLRR